MKTMYLLLVFIILTYPLHAQSVQNALVKSLVFTGVTVIDATGTPPKPDMTVVITGDLINTIGKTGKVQVPTNAQVVDASGKYLIPGLWDMHVHVLFEGIPELFFPMYIANGVTGVRDMSSNLELAKQLRKKMEKDSLTGPRIVAASPIVDGATPFWPGSISVTNAVEAREAVQSLKKSGADFVKVYSGLTS